MEILKKKTVKTNEDGTTKNFYNYFLVVNVNGEEKSICITNKFKGDWRILDLVSRYVDESNI